MDEHGCIHEGDWGESKAMQKVMHDDIKEILITLKGNGKEGICTRVAVLERNQKWSWSVISAVGTGVLSLAGYLAKILWGE